MVCGRSPFTESILQNCCVAFVASVAMTREYYKADNTHPFSPSSLPPSARYVLVGGEEVVRNLRALQQAGWWLVWTSNDPDEAVDIYEGEKQHIKKHL